MRLAVKIVVIFISLLWTNVILAQYPVTTTITLIPPHTNQLSALHSSSSNKMMVTVLLNDDEEPSYQAKLRFKILGDGYTIETNPNFFPSPIVLDYNIPLVLQGYELSEYFQPANLIFQGLDQQQFQQTGRLPEGPFSICVEVYDFIRDFELPVSNEACAFAYVEEHDPPVIITPIGTQQVYDPFTLEFTWQPMHIAAFPAQYNLFVFEKIPGLSANQILTSTAPLFTINTPGLSYLHTAVDPPLDLDQAYLVVVQLEDLTGEAAIKNDGFSEVEEFILLTQGCITGGPCDDNDPCTINDVFTGNCVCEGTPAVDSDNDTVCDPIDQCPGEDDTIDANQNGIPDCLETDGGECITGNSCDDNDPCTENDTIDDNCDCMGTPIPDCDYNACLLDWTPIPYECGSNNGNIDVDAMPLINYLEPLDTIIASDFLVVLKNVTINSDGTFTGVGYIAPEFFNLARVNLEFENIKVDEGCRMVEGVMGVTGAGIQIIDDSLAATIQDIVDILEQIDTVLATAEDILEAINPVLTEVLEIDDYFTDGWTSLNPDFILNEYPYLDPSVVQGLEDAIECIKSNPANYEQCSEQLAQALEDLKEALELMFNATEQITFLDNPNSFNGFDNMIYPALESQYNKIKVAGKDYYVPWKSVKSGQSSSDLVDAVMPDSKPFPDNIRFETNTKEAVPSTDVENIKELTAKGTTDKETHQIYPIEKRNDSTFLAGKLNVISYDELDLKLTIIPVNGAEYPYNENDLKLALDSIFGQAVVKPIVTMHPGISVPEFNDYLDDISTGVFSNYSDEMNDIIDAFEAANTIDPDGYYVFLLKNSDDPTLLGYMPKTKQFGFVVNATHPALAEKTYINTIAHELGHGAYNLAHTFEQFPNLTKESTDNLMDYADGRHLCKYQWDQIRNPGGGLTIFNGDDEGENVTARGLFNRFEFGENEDNTFSFLTPSGEYLVLPDTVRGVTVFFGFGSVSEQGEIDKFIHLTPGTLKGFTVGEKVFSAKIDLNTAGVPVLDGYYNGQEKYEPVNYEINPSLSFNNKAILFGSNRQDYSFYWLDATGVSAYSTSNALVNVLDFPVQFTGSYLARKEFAYAQYQQIFGNSQYSLTKENVEWAFHSNWNPSDGTFLLRNKIAELRQAYPTLINFVTRDYDDWNVCSTTYYRQSASTFEKYLNDLYCDCTSTTSQLNGGTTYNCNDKPNVDKPQYNEKLRLFTMYYNWLNDNSINVVIQGYETLSEWNANPDLIDDVENNEAIFQAINFANVSDFEQLKSLTILKLLSKMANNGLFDSETPNLDGEGALVKLVENVPAPVAREVVLGIEGNNLYDQDKWLYIQMFSRANDKFLGFFGDNNKQKLVTGFVRLSFLAESLYNERIDGLIQNLDDRMFVLEYQNIILRTAEQIAMNSLIHKILVGEAFDEYYEDYDIEVEHNKDNQNNLNGTIDGIQELQKGWFQEEELFRAKNLKPFDLVYFANKSNLRLIKGFEAENLDSKDFPLPAIVLMYADKTATTETVSQVAYTTLDIVSIAAGVGIPAKVGKLAKAVTYFDIASSVTSLGATVTSDQANSQLNSILNNAAAISGVFTIGLGGASKVKNLFNTAGDVPNIPKPSAVADELIALPLSQRKTIADNDDLFVKLSYMLRKAIQEADDYPLKQKLENALNRLKVARGLDVLSELKNKFTHIDDLILDEVAKLNGAENLLNTDIPATAPKAFFDDILASTSGATGLGKNLHLLNKHFYLSWGYLAGNGLSSFARNIEKLGVFKQYFSKDYTGFENWSKLTVERHLDDVANSAVVAQKCADDPEMLKVWESLRAHVDDIDLNTGDYPPPPSYWSKVDELEAEVYKNPFLRETGGFSNTSGLPGYGVLKMTQFGPGPTTGFSGIYDVVTKRIMIYPSGDCKYIDGSTIPSSSLVAKYGGHAQIRDKMVGYFPDLTAEAARKQVVGFSMSYKNAGEFEMKYNSWSCNGVFNKHYKGNLVVKDNQVPLEYRPSLLDELDKEFKKRGHNFKFVDIPDIPLNQRLFTKFGHNQTLMDQIAALPNANYLLQAPVAAKIQEIGNPIKFFEDVLASKDIANGLGKNLNQMSVELLDSWKKTDNLVEAGDNAFDVLRKDVNFLNKFDEVRKDAKLNEHVLVGEVKPVIDPNTGLQKVAPDGTKQWNVTGAHSKSSLVTDKLMIKGSKTPENPGPDDYYTAKIEAKVETFTGEPYLPNNGWKVKGPPSTFFPDSWSPEKIQAEISRVLTNNPTVIQTKADGSKLLGGIMSDGVDLRIWQKADGSFISAFPRL